MNSDSTNVTRFNSTSLLVLVTNFNSCLLRFLAEYVICLFDKSMPTIVWFNNKNNVAFYFLKVGSL